MAGQKGEFALPDVEGDVIEGFPRALKLSSDVDELDQGPDRSLYVDKNHELRPMDTVRKEMLNTGHGSVKAFSREPHGKTHGFHHGGWIGRAGPSQVESRTVVRRCAHERKP